VGWVWVGRVVMVVVTCGAWWRGAGLCGACGGVVDGREGVGGGVWCVWGRRGGVGCGSGVVGWVWVACGWRLGGGGWVGMGERGEGGGRRGVVQLVRVAWQGAVVVCGGVVRVVWWGVCGVVLRGCVGGGVRVCGVCGGGVGCAWWGCGVGRGVGGVGCGV
jgi:hypothetical protein